mgnify:CR=1 FL=1
MLSLELRLDRLKWKQGAPSLGSLRFTFDITVRDIPDGATLLAGGYVPVVASLGGDDERNVYNINADTLAEALAVALRAQKLIFLTGAPGVLRSAADPSTLVTFADPDDLAALLASGAIAGGMRPKVEACIRAATSGVERTHIIDGRAADSLLYEVFTGAGCGTMIVGRKQKDTYLGVDLADTPA